jgi:hypothetical protein
MALFLVIFVAGAIATFLAGSSYPLLIAFGLDLVIIHITVQAHDSGRWR